MLLENVSVVVVDAVVVVVDKFAIVDEATYVGVGFSVVVELGVGILVVVET